MIQIKDLSVTLPGFSICDVNLRIRKNDFFVLLGPSGAGKTVLLEAIAGLVKISSGAIRVNNQDVTGCMPEKRGIAIVYQDCCLFPHLTVRKNIEYGLHYHNKDAERSAALFKMLVEKLDIAHLVGRKPGSLSGGEKQRVAIARALMIEPAVLLLDEPLSAIDPHFRGELQRQLKRLHQSTKTTFVMVTHNFSEALSLATRAAIINRGRIEQDGDLLDIFKKPCSKFVADFVGMKNIFSSKFLGSRALVNGISIQTGQESSSGHGYIAIRPEDIVLSRAHLDSSIRNCFRGTVESIIDVGFNYDIHVTIGETDFRSLITRGALIDLKIREGDDIYLSFKATAVHYFNG